MKRLLWITAFLLGTPLVMVLSLFILVHYTSLSAPPQPPAPQVLSSHSQLYSPAYILSPVIAGSVSAADARPIIIKNYLRQFSSPLEPFSDTIIQTSDKYSLDYRLLVAIARQESNLCKRIPDDSHNCWGFGIYGDKVVRFSDYPSALDTVARTLKKQYIDKGLDTPEKIMVKYTPPSVLIGGPWAKGVSQFMAELE